jgi:hypothetical protein
MALNTYEVRLGLDQHRLRRWVPYILGHESAAAWASELLGCIGSMTLVVS